MTGGLHVTHIINIDIWIVTVYQHLHIILMRSHVEFVKVTLFDSNETAYAVRLTNN